MCFLSFALKTRKEAYVNLPLHQEDGTVSALDVFSFHHHNLCQIPNPDLSVNEITFDVKQNMCQSMEVTLLEFHVLPS